MQEYAYCPKVTVYNVNKLFPWNRELAAKYSVSKSDPASICRTNARLSAEAGRRDLTKMWLLVRKIIQLKMEEEKNSNNVEKQEMESVPWCLHPMGKPLLKSILDRCLNIGDFQTSALILCVLNSLQETQNQQVKLQMEVVKTVQVPVLI